MGGNDFELEPLLEAVSGDRDVMSQVIHMFIQSSQGDLDAMRDAIQRSDATALKVAAHHLKGSLLEFNARKAAALALKLESLAKARQLTDADPVWRELHAAIAVLVEDLSQTGYLCSS